MQADMGIAHLAFELGPRHQRRHRVDDQHVDRAGAHQRVGDLERLLAGIGLRDQQLVDIDAELAGIGRVERMLGIDEGAGAARLLGLGDHVQGERGLARAFRPVDLDDAAARQAADAERDVEAERAGGDRLGSRRRSRCWPSFMIEPLPKARSIWPRAASNAFDLSMPSLSTTFNAGCDMRLLPYSTGWMVQCNDANVPSLF